MSVSTALFGSGCTVIGFAAAVFVAWRVSGRVVNQQDTVAVRIFVALVLGLTQLIGVELLCGAVVALYAPVILAVHVVIAALVWRTVRPGARLPDRSGPMGWTGALLGGVLAFAAVVAAVLSARGAPTDPDDVAYHLPNAASWMRIHDLWHLPAVDPGFFTNTYPSNGELLTSWIMQPFHGAQLSAFPTLLFGILLLSAAAVISEQLGSTATVGLLAGATVALAPLSWQTQVHSALTDWTSASGLLAAVAFVLRGRHDARGRWPLLAGLALGIGIGSKDTAILPGVFIVVFALVILPRAMRWRSLPFLGIGVIGLAGLWFIRTGVQTGNPIYPEPVRFAGVTLLAGGVSPLTVYSTSLAKDLFSFKLHGLRVWGRFVRTLIGPPAIVCAGVLVGLWSFRRRAVLALTSGLAVLFFLAYLATPYTGPETQAFLIASQLRYALAALVLAAVCACVASRRVLPVACVAVGADLISISHHSTFASGVNASKAVLLAGGLVGALVVWVLRRANWAAWRPGAPSLGVELRIVAGTAMAIAAVGSGAVLAVRHVQPASALDRALATSAQSSATGQGRQALSSSSAGVRVMIIGDTNVFASLGSRLDHALVGGGTGVAGEVPINSAAQLNQKILAQRPAAIVVGPVGAPGVIAGWSPPGYRLLGTNGNNRVYVTQPSVPPSVSTTTPAAPVTVPPAPTTTVPPLPTVPRSPGTTIP